MYRWPWPAAGELAMDDGCSSWLPAFQQGGDAASERSCCGSELVQQEPQDLPISYYQVDEQLQQIYLLMGMEEHGRRHAEEVAPSSQSSAAFRSFSGTGSLDEASSLIITPGRTSSTNSRRHTPEVSPPVTFAGDGDHYYYGQCYYGNLDNTIIPTTLEGFTCQQAQHHERRERGAAGAFVPYSRHLSTKKKLKPPGSGGQRAIKAAISALARMHTVRLAQWRRQCYHQMEMASAAPPPPAGTSNNDSCNKLQHVMSERKRREKLNDSFKELKTVLPPAPKIDKASILTAARDYVNTLKSRVSELEEKNRMFVELQRRHNNGVDPDDVSSEEIQVSIDRATAEEVYLKIVVRSGCNAMDVVVGILECLKEIGDVRLAAMDTGNRSTTLTLQMKTSRCDDNFLKEYVIKSVKGVMQSKIETS